jgi:hypothetical protein
VRRYCGRMALLRGQQLTPIICTYAEAQAILGPVAFGYPWAEGTIRDLWTRCAPTPDSLLGTATERRIISPAHLGEWLEDVLARQGRPLSDAARIYNQFAGANHGR